MNTEIALIYRVLIWVLINEISSDYGIRLPIYRSTFLHHDDLFILDIPIYIDGVILCGRESWHTTRVLTQRGLRSKGITKKTTTE